MKSQRISLLALAIAGSLSGVAHADPSGITLYGVLDAAVGDIQHSFSVDSRFPASVNPFSPILSDTSGQTGKSLSGMFNGGIQDSRWGLRGSEDLGDGMKAVFTLESGINLPTGQLNNATGALAANSQSNGTASAASSLSGQLFNRQSWVGLSDSKLGTLTFGRQYQPIYDILVTYDPVQLSQLFSPLGFSGSFGGGVGVTDEMRVDNSIKYSNTIDGFNVAALYKLGGVAGHNGAASDWAIRLGYEADTFGVQAAYERITDGLAPAQLATAGAALDSVKVNNVNSLGYMLAAKYRVTDAGTLKAGYQRYTVGKPSDPFASLNINSAFGYPIASATNQAGDAVTTTVFAGGDYNITSKDNIAVGYYLISPQSSAVQKPSDQRFYSVLFDHNYSKRTDVYAGVDFAQFSGAGVAADYSSNRIIALGMRDKF